MDCHSHLRLSNFSNVVAFLVSFGIQKYGSGKDLFGSGKCVVCGKNAGHVVYVARDY